jgi:hypothetical protein
MAAITEPLFLHRGAIRTQSGASAARDVQAISAVCTEHLPTKQSMGTVTIRIFALLSAAGITQFLCTVEHFLFNDPQFRAFLLNVSVDEITGIALIPNHPNKSCSGDVFPISPHYMIFHKVVADSFHAVWTPIGPSESSAYTGTFDGQGHTVRNLSITGDVKRAGLFGCVIGGAIRKLTVAGSVSCTVDQGWCGGIAGYAERETIENCASLCTVSYTGKDARVGGIVGYVPSSSSMTIICDCYNIGNITGSSDTGGICGYNLSGRIFNCYNVGEITGGNYVSKIVGYGQANNNPTNCYYLSDTDTDPAAKTAAEFADRTVMLKLLKAGRNDSPWDSCQYVATAGITLPVFNGQGDAHNANGGRQEQLRVTKQLFVVSELLVGQAAKFLPGKTANKEIARDNIIILKGTVQRQTIHFARIVADKRHIVL